MKVVARKKIVFVIVEGPSDDEALGLLLERIYDKNKVHVFITHGDITTERGIDSQNILRRIGEVVKGYAKSNHLTNNHFQEIVHIVDMDGAYVPDAAVVENPDKMKPFYTPTNIQTADVVGIRERNNRKRKCLDRISSNSSIWGIPYQVYYMSSNLDHVLYDMQNASDRDKEVNAMAFARKYKDSIDEFHRFISESSFSVSGDYLETWRYIRTGVHSLERHTNLGICLQRAKASQD